MFVSTLQRLNAILVALGLGLLLGAAYLSSALSAPDAGGVQQSNRPLALAFPLLTAAHMALSALHTPRILSRIGLHSAAYVGLIVGLGGVFGGLAAWGALS